MSDDLRKAYAEIDEIIEVMGKDFKEKIPENIRKLFKEEKDQNYKKRINTNIPIEGQNLLDDTFAIFALLNLKYICNDEVEKERLMNIYKRNQTKFDEIMHVTFDEEQVFDQNDIEKVETKFEEELPVVSDKNLFQKIWCKIVSFFKKEKKYE